MFRLQCSLLPGQTQRPANTIPFHASAPRSPAHRRTVRPSHDGSRSIRFRLHASSKPPGGNNSSQTSLSRRHTLLLGLLPALVPPVALPYAAQVRIDAFSLHACTRSQPQAEPTTAAAVLGGAVNQALSGLQTTAQDSFNALPTPPSVPDIDLSPSTLQTSLADGVTGALTSTPTPAAMGAGVASIVAASVIANKAKEVSTLQRTVADLEAQRQSLTTQVGSLEGTLTATQQELSNSLTVERARVAQLQRSLENGEQAAAKAAADAAQAAAAAAAAQAALQANVQELTQRGVEVSEMLEQVAAERDAALIRSDQVTDQLAQVTKQLQTAEQTVYKLEEELTKSVKSGKEQATALAHLEGKMATLNQQLQAQEAANDSLRVQAATLEAQLEETAEQLRTEEARAAESGTQLAHYTRLAGHLEERIAEELERSSKLQEEMQEATSSLEEQLTKSEEQSQKLDILEKARAAAVEDTKQALAQEREGRYQLEDERAKVAQLTVDLQDAGERYAQLQDRLKETEGLLGTAQVHAEGMQGQIQQLQDEVAWAKQAYLEERETREDAERRAQDAQSRAEELSVTHQSMQHELAALQERSGSLQASLALAESQQDALDDANRQVALLSDELAQLTHVAKGDIRKLNLELIQTRGEAELLRQEAAERVRALQQAKSALDATQDELEGVRTAYKETAKVAAEATERLEALADVEGELATVKQQLSDTTARLEAGEGQQPESLSQTDFNTKVGELEVSRAKVAALEEQLEQTQGLLARVREEAAWASSVTPADVRKEGEGVAAMVEEVREQAQMAAVEARAQAAMMVEAIEDQAVRAIEEAQLEAQRYQAEVEALRTQLAQKEERS